MSVDLRGTCTTSGDCQIRTLPICREGVCVGCSGTADCPITTPFCLGTGACVECETKSQCAQKNLTCVSNKCVACTTNDDCASHLCVDGACAGVSEVLFVDNMNGTCSGTQHSGAFGDAYCGISDAIANLAGKGYVSVAGSSTPYAEVSLTGNTKVYIVGPGRDVSKKATITAAVATSSDVAVGANTNVTLDGLEISGAQSTKNGVECGGASATI